MDNAIGLASEKTTPKVENGLPEIGARLDRLASSKVVWKIMVLLALGGLFDAYMISTGGNIAPGLYKSHLLTAASKSFFDPHSYAAFNAATFVGLLVASLGCGFIAENGHLPAYRAQSASALPLEIVAIAEPNAAFMVARLKPFADRPQHDPS